MQKTETVVQLRDCLAPFHTAHKIVALVPTMGAIHGGHRALIAAARERADIVVVSIFVNPLQFGLNELPAAYPRDPEGDERACAEAGVDVVFTPSVAEIYPRGFSSYVTEEVVSRPLCGVARPAYFRGVTTVTTKLFNVVQPALAFYGQKDLQQAAVVRKLVADLAFAVEIVVVPTWREPDGLAAGVRNPLLTATQRQEARAIYGALEEAKAMVAKGVRSPDRVVAEATHILSQHRRVRVIYVAIVDQVTMEAARGEIIPGRSVLTIAVWIDEIRFIDNVLL
ncbi:pantoate--beta-alanine ligase [Horticoccus luteus]|uniref:Pantothenate synthetase n=1 Tax=Horticoccus luteus TaxID=2862869 RepID=A0A8F9XHY2_9BACT|nr:pantoate--beta-alanine ligase [Horticoccus luteus]QYM79840.1 pantoate--beta-alanine ligase [Horticoccus luteus]